MRKEAMLPTRRIKHIHFIGIAGSGMSGIAELMLNLGYQISGSDLNANSTTERLVRLGATVYQGHQKQHIEGAEVIVVSSAISEGNPELKAAYEARIPVVPRAQMLAEMMRFRQGIAVAGSHGKTTSTSLIATVLAEAGLDPTYVIGGRLNSSGSHARLGESPYLVVEADESDASFLCLMPTIAVVTNIEPEHLTHYGSDFEKLKQAYVQFLHSLPFYGLAVLCIDCPVIQELLPKIQRPIVTYGRSSEADIRLMHVEQHGLKTHFTYQTQHAGVEEMRINLPGEHNALNALAVIAIAKELGVSIPSIFKALDSFQGIDRRFQVHEDMQVGSHRVTLVDDYGHHPTEVSVTLNAIREGWPEKRVVVVFQPHRYSRTRDLFEDFTAALSKADALLLMEVYPAGEERIMHADSRALCRNIRQRGQIEPVFVENHEALIPLLQNNLHDGDILLMQGAGDIGNLTKQLVVESEKAFLKHESAGLDVFKHMNAGKPLC